MAGALAALMVGGEGIIELLEADHQPEFVSAEFAGFLDTGYVYAPFIPIYS